MGTKQPDISYVDRSAVRVIIFRASGQKAIVYAKRDNYYKLPGGGNDRDEDHVAAVVREMQEETGAKYRNDLHQISYCYVADVVDDSGSPCLTEDEVSDGLGHLWLSVDEAKKRMVGVEPTAELGNYIKERDIYFLWKADKVGKGSH